VKRGTIVTKAMVRKKKYKRACETPKIYENAQIFRSELRVARGMRG